MGADITYLATVPKKVFPITEDADKVLYRFAILLFEKQWMTSYDLDPSMCKLIVQYSQSTKPVLTAKTHCHSTFFRY